MNEFFVGSKGRQTNSDGSFTKFRFADPKNDVANIQSGRITRLINVNEGQVKSMLIKAGAFNANNRARPASFLLEAGPAGKDFDFSFTKIPSQFGIPTPVKDAEGNFVAPNIFLINGVINLIRLIIILKMELQ